MSNFLHINNREQKGEGGSSTNDSGTPAVFLALTVRVGEFMVLRPQDAFYTARGACLKSKS